MSAEAPGKLQRSIDLWLEQDHNDETRREIRGLCSAKNWPELHKRLDSRLQFGTAGLRARMEAGFNRMNTLIVTQATQGLASYIKKQFPEHLVAVVGHDHRFNSKEFAMATATVFLKSGFKVYYLNRKESFVHTPMVPFTVDRIKASVGVMITASHNPKMDNGYKVYYANGCQIIPPHDLAIAKSIEANLEPWDGVWDWTSIMDQAATEGKLIYARAEMVNQYVNCIGEKLVEGISALPRGTPWFVYTPMHGVGYNIFHQIACQTLKLEVDRDYLVVPEQKEPNPEFPTVHFPNPEEKGALDLAIDLANHRNISLVLASDPDADRFSVAVRETSGNWRQLTGNEIGFLFAYYELQKYRHLKPEFRKSHPLAMLNSTVSSQMISKMAAVEGFHHEDTLTGFKWIGNRAVQLEQRGYYVPFGFEEAIGYMFPVMENDKDGISAAVVFLQAYNQWISDGTTPSNVLESGFRKYGVFREYNGYYLVSEPSLTNKTFAKIRDSYMEKNEKYPEAVGELRVTAFRDLTVGFQSNTANNVPDLPVDSSSQMITIEAKPKDGHPDEHVRFTLRGSGTEPKLKVYIEACSQSEAQATNLAKETWQILKKEWFTTPGLSTNF
ncbi:probable Phosphoglucomutase-3 [Zygosaccharomyces bailii]|nr:probable Phosphoglucomutase-3 [Zygosaccharomyces bailii]